MKIKLLFAIMLISINATAQFDDAGDDFGEDFKDEISKELEVNNKQKSTNVKSSKSSETFDSVSISSADVKKLADAKKSRSEAAIVRAASEILSRDSEHILTLNTLGLHYYEQKKYGMAKILFKRALKAAPSEPALYNNLGLIYLAEDDLRLAVDSFQKSVNLKSSYQIGATNLSSIYLEFGDFKRSLAPLEVAYKATRSDLRQGGENAVAAANNYALALMGIGEDGKAKGIYEDIYSSNSRNPIPILNYAILLVEVQKKKKDAVRVISKLKFMTEDRKILRQVDELEKKLE